MKKLLWYVIWIGILIGVGLGGCEKADLLLKSLGAAQATEIGLPSPAPAPAWNCEGNFSACEIHHSETRGLRLH